MVRFLGVVQGGFGLVVILAAVGKTPLWLTGLALALVIGCTVIIGSILREKTPKGKERELVEFLISFFGLVGGVVYICNNKVYTLSSPTPLWFLLIGITLVLINWGIYVAWICWILGCILGYLQEFLEFISGEHLSPQMEVRNGGGQ
jgi:hypothetical protein